MKKITGLLALGAVIAAPSMALAGQSGLYVAPKLGMGGLMGFESSNTFSEYTGGALTDWETGKQTFGGSHGFGAALAVGYDFHKTHGTPARVELEYAMFKSKSERIDNWHGDGWSDYHSRKTDLDIHTLFVNAYRDFRSDSALTPYVGMGLGLAFVGAKGSQSSDWTSNFSLGKDTKTNFAWNIGGGVAYAFSDKLSLDVGYRFASLGKGQTKESVIDDLGGGDFYTAQFKTGRLYTHQLMVGARFAF
ncbi:MAG: acyloxyacyl hydrolase [Alphaproteobacteria bacterium]|nr:acyloxyacyl hydrolase [Alphaproteobacteria bacterium]